MNPKGSFLLGGEERVTCVTRVRDSKPFSLIFEELATRKRETGTAPVRREIPSLSALTFLAIPNTWRYS